MRIVPPRDVPEPVLQAARTYRRLLEQRFGDRLVAVRIFGSYARGDAEDDSDIDVAVVVRGLTEGERTDAIDLAFEAWTQNRAVGPLSPLVWSDAELDDRLRAERRIAEDVLSEGIPL